jgi:hypothetical protein
LLILGIYVKTRWSDAGPSKDFGISNVLFENITIIEPEQFAIWIGPAQQLGQKCGLLWPGIGKCLMSGFQTIKDLVLKDGNLILMFVTVINPKNFIGNLLGNDTNPIQGLVFDNVVVKDQTWWNRLRFGDNFKKCEGVDGRIVNGASPVPSCFANK